MAARCNYYAKWATGDQQAAWSADELWLNGKTLPSACDRLFSVWRGAGKQTPLDILARMKLALKEGNSSLVSNLYSQLPADYQTMGNALVRCKTIRPPWKPSPAAWGRPTLPAPPPASPLSAGAAGCGKRAGDDPDACAAAEMSDDERLGLEEAVAWRLMGSDATFEQAQWRDQVILRSRSPSLLERRVRMALGNGDRQGVATAGAPAGSVAQQDEWRYWRASQLMDEGKRAEGGRYA